MSATLLKLKYALSGDTVAVENGSLLIRTDTGRMEVDLGGVRHDITDVRPAAELPLAPVMGKLYIHGDGLWLHNGTSWIQVDSPTTPVTTLTGTSVSISPGMYAEWSIIGTSNVLSLSGWTEEFGTAVLKLTMAQGSAVSLGAGLSFTAPPTAGMTNWCILRGVSGAVEFVATD